MLSISNRSSAAVNVTILAIQKAARVLVRDFGELEKLQVSSKSLSLFALTAAKRAEHILLEDLSAARPEYDILTEGRGEILAASPRSKFDQNGGFRWIINPLDGAINFLHGIPHFSISVAIEHHGEPIAGVVHNPITSELFWGEKGKGAFLNNQRIRVSGRRTLESALIGLGSPFGFGKMERAAQCLKMILSKVHAFRHLGANSLDLAFVAAGRLDAFFEAGAPLWTSAAGSVLVREAGGSASPWMNGVVASNEPLHKDILKMITSATTEKNSF
ncbi:MAG: inositol monophosphatase [Holosporales bacterium]|jgi:myo-inositol-1(or 4)-monophosphatase|nr:inositol monophosphatase [Holosporales bacterium]